MNTCDICIEETCKGKHDCHCSTCKLASQCPRFLHPTVRITNRCTQSCSHCCFESSPKSDIMMSIDKAKEIALFFRSNEIKSVNLMGGEFFCNPSWYEILDILLSEVISARLVTNGDWANNEEVKSKLSLLISKYSNVIRFGISKDRWHTNKNVDSAASFLESQGTKYHITEPKEATDSSIVPIGRSFLQGSFYSMMGCYCHNPANKYSFLIDEEGYIYKCPFGVWEYANVSDYLNGGFSVRFKEFNKKFYDIFIVSCASCIRVAESENSCVKV